MLSKRAFLQRAAVATVVAAVAPWRSARADDGVRVKQRSPEPTPARTPPGPAADSFDLVVFNDWYPHARAFAETFTKQHVRALAIAGDAGKLWYETLRHLVHRGASRIVGMTTHTDLLILATLARDRGFKVRYRGEPEGLVPQVLVSWVLSC